MSDILPTSVGDFLHNEYYLETNVLYDSEVCGKRFRDKIEATTALPISMIPNPSLHGFTIPADFNPELIANVTIKCPNN